jgi:hypothetical protein
LPCTMFSQAAMMKCTCSEQQAMQQGMRQEPCSTVTAVKRKAADATSHHNCSHSVVCTCPLAKSALF